MLALGLSVDFPKTMRPVVHAVLLSDPYNATPIPTLADITVAAEFDLTSAEEDWAKLASDYFQATSGRISTLRPAAVIIRRADMPKRPNNYDGPRLRLVIEGALAAAAYQHVTNTRLRTGVACANAYNKSDKSTLDAHGKGLVQKATRFEAAGAALSGLIDSRT